MTAGAMVLGMTPDGAGCRRRRGARTPPLGRAVIGGLIFRGRCTLIFVSAMYADAHPFAGGY